MRGRATLIAQLSDLHLRADGADPCHDPAEALRAAFAAISRLDQRPEAIVFTGDLLDRSTKDYTAAKSLLAAAPAPLWPMPGNHDDPQAFRAAFAEGLDFAEGHQSYSAPLGGMELIALDSNLVSPSGAILGGVDALRLAWLSAELAKASRPVVLALHHPPFATGLAHLDQPGFAGAGALADLVAGSAVTRVIAGHSHRGIRSLWAGVEASTAPALGHGLSLSFAGEKHLPDCTMAPGFELHSALPSGAMVSHQIGL